MKELNRFVDDYFPIENCKPYEVNSKIHTEEQIKLIANSIEKFGFTQPIVLDEDNIILAGHGRFMASKLLNLQEVPVWIIKELTEDQKRAYRILDNKLNQDTGFDLQSLKIEMDKLHASEFDINSFGLNFDLSSLVNNKELPVKEEKVPFLDTIITNIKIGDVINLGRHRLMCGDSTNLEHVTMLLNQAVTKLMVTDPPYGVNYDPSWRECEHLDYVELSKGVVRNDDRSDWREVFKLWDTEVIYCWHAGIFAASVAEQLESSGYKIVSQIIWTKPNFAISRGDYHWKHEPCWYACKGKHNWQGARDQSTLWEISNNTSFDTQDKEGSFGHSTQKPIECMARPIRNNSKIGDIVVDPFLGSGTTLIACEHLERICYGMELDPRYCQLIVNRFNKLTGETNA